MIKSTVHIDKYDWKVTIYYAVTGYHIDEILCSLREVECPFSIRVRVRKNLNLQEMDSGFTYSNKPMRRTIMVIGLHSSPAQFLNSVEHEIRHLADDMASYFAMEPKGEEVAYLTGDINQQIINEVRLFICDCPCHVNEINRKISK